MDSTQRLCRRGRRAHRHTLVFFLPTLQILGVSNRFNLQLGPPTCAITTPLQQAAPTELACRMLSSRLSPPNLETQTPRPSALQILRPESRATHRSAQGPRGPCDRPPPSEAIGRGTPSRVAAQSSSESRVVLCGLPPPESSASDRRGRTRDRGAVVSIQAHHQVEGLLKCTLGCRVGPGSALRGEFGG